MPLYVMLGKLRANGLSRAHHATDTYHETLSGPHHHGEVMDFYPVIGQYDYVMMAHATSPAAAARLSSEIAVKMEMKITTLPTVRDDDNETATAEPPATTTGVREPRRPRSPRNAAGTAAEPATEPDPARQGNAGVLA